MRFCVRVPVLSEQITDTLPKDSTALRSLMMACSRAIFCVPMASTMVTMELSASGMAATANATANMRESSTPMPLRNTDSRNTSTDTAMTPRASFFENSSRLAWSGVLRCSVSFMSEAMRPISVPMPVAVATASARP